MEGIGDSHRSNEYWGWTRLLICELYAALRDMII